MMDVKSYVNDLKTSTNNSSKAIEGIITRIEKIEKLVNEGRLSKIENELKDLSAEVSVLSSYMNKTGKGKGAGTVDYSSKIKDIYSSLGKQRVDIDTLKSGLESLKNELVSVKSGYDSISEELSKIDSQMYKLERDVQNIDILGSQIGEVMASMQKILDKLVEIESEIASLRDTQGKMIKWKESVSSAFSSKIEVSKPGQFEDKEITEIKKRLTTAKSRKAILKSKNPPETKKQRQSQTQPGMPIIEEITIGGKKEKGPKGNKVDEILKEVKNTDPRKWGPLKDELTSLLEKDLKSLEGKIKTKHPPNEKALNLMLMQTELGITSLSAAFESSDYSRVEAVVNRIMSMMKNIKGAFKG